jgi:hypothetical protein
MVTVGMGSNIRAALCYFAALPLAIVAAFALTALAFKAAKGTPALWIGLLINVVPAVLAGFLVFAIAARWLNQRGWFVTGWTAHLMRASSLYVLALLALVVIAIGWSSPDFWMVAQIPLWTGLAALGGLVLDALLSRRPLPSDAHAA